MRVLLDNCVDRRFGSFVNGHEVIHVLDRAWDRLVNGRLLDVGEEADFDVLLTVDKNMKFQQNFAARKISLMSIEAPKIDLESLRPFAPLVEARLSEPLLPGSVIIFTEADLRR